MLESNLSSIQVMRHRFICIISRNPNSSQRTHLLPQRTSPPSSLPQLLRIPHCDLAYTRISYRPSIPPNTLLGVIQHRHPVLQTTRFYRNKMFETLKSLSIRQSFARCSPPPPWPQSGLPACRVDDAFLKMFTSSVSSGGHDNDDHGTENRLDDPTECLCLKFNSKCILRNCSIKRKTVMIPVNS